jgi:hypothetical protein
MKKIILILLLTMIFIIGCSQNITCNTPYILVGGSCCLDKDNNSICDKDETKTEPENINEVIKETVEETKELSEADLFKESILLESKDGVTLSLDSFDVEIQNENLAKITKIKVTILNKGAKSIIPSINIYLWDEAHLSGASVVQEVLETDGWIEVGHYKTTEFPVSILFNEINEEKNLKLVLYEMYGFKATLSRNIYASLITKFNTTQIGEYKEGYQKEEKEEEKELFIEIKEDIKSHNNYNEIKSITAYISNQGYEFIRSPKINMYIIKDNQSKKENILSSKLEIRTLSNDGSDKATKKFVEPFYQFEKNITIFVEIEDNEGNMLVTKEKFIEK